MFVFTPNTLIESAKINSNFADSIDSSKHTNPYMFRVRRSAAYTTISTTYTALPFDTKVFDIGSNVDVVTNKGRFTAPLTGYYWFSAGFGFAIAGYQIIKFYVNGVEASHGTYDYYNAGGQSSHCLATDLLYLTAGQYVEVIYYSDGAKALDVTAAANHFSGFLVSK